MDKPIQDPVLPHGVKFNAAKTAVIFPDGSTMTRDDIINILLEGREKHGWDLEAGCRELDMTLKPPEQ